MYSPSSAGVTVVGSSLATSCAPVDHVEGVGQADQLLEVGRDEQHGEVGGPGLAEVVPDGGLGADVDASGGLGGDEHRRVGHHLAADDELLLVAAGQREGGDVGPGVRTSNSSMICFGALA